MIAGQLEIQLMANIARISDDMHKVQSTVGGAMSSIEKAVASAKSALETLGVGISIGAIASYAKGLVDAAEQMDKMSERTGIAVGPLSELKFAASLGEVEFGALGKAIGFFNLQIVAATDKTSKQARMFSELGIDLTKGPNEALLQFARRASEIDNASVKTAVFRAALSKLGDQFIPVFKNLDETTAQARRLGITMSTETAVAAARLNDNLKTLKAQTDAFTTKNMDGIVSAFVTITDNITKAAEKGDKWLQILKEIVKLDLALKSKLPGPVGDLFGMAADKMFAEGGSRSASGKIGGLPTTPPPDSGALARILAENEAKVLALQKRQIAALQQMEEKKKALFGITEEEIMLQRIQTGTYKDFDDVTAVLLLNMAVEIDRRKQMLEILKLNGEAYDSLYKSQKVLNDLQTAGFEGDKLYLEDLQLQFDLIGKSAAAQQQMNEMRRIELNLRQQLKAAADAAGDNWNQFEAAFDQLTAQAEAQKAIVKASISSRIEAERSWDTGAKMAINDYLENVASAANQSRTLFTSAFMAMEDALVNFVKNGKLDFRSLADSIITDLIRIQIQNSIMKPLAGAMGSGGGLFGLLSNLIGGGGLTTNAGQGGADFLTSAIPGIAKMAAGGDFMVTRPTLFLAGEAGPERATFSGAGNAGGGTVNHFTVDMRGASVEAVARLERLVLQVNGSIESRAVAATNDWSRRR